MTEGFLYEPRSLWSIVNVAATAQEQTVRFDKRHFYNGERWPIEIRRIAIAAVNYILFDTVDTGGAVPAGTGANESSAVINRCRLELSAPQRYHINTKRRVLTAALAPDARWMPPPRLSTVDAGDFTPSSLWGQCFLNFDKPLILPRTASIEWDLSAYTTLPNLSTGGGSEQDVPVYATMLWQESGGLLPGSARSRRVALQPFVGDLTQADPLEKWPYPLDGYGTSTPAAGAGTTSQDWWGAQSRFPAAGGGFAEAPTQPATPQFSFAGQESTRAGSTQLEGMRTHIEQIAYDEYMAESGFDSRPQATPLSLRVGTRVRTVSGGSNTWWWRPGAPLALVCDTVTPAAVYVLKEPITLGPGEQLDLQLQVPANISSYTTNFHVGVALNGFAAIEG